MPKTSLLIGIFFSLLGPKLVWAKATFIQGFAVVEGVKSIEIQTLDALTIVICNPVCEIESGGAHITIPFPGFGTLGQLSRLNGHEKELSQILSQKPDAKPKDSPPPSQGDKKSSRESKAEIEKIPEGQFPYPKDKTLFLHQNSTTLLLAPKSVCQHSCLLSINKDGGKGIEKNFGAGEKPVLQVAVSKEYQGSMTWTLTGDGDAVQGRFDVQILSNETFKKALTDQRLVEVLP